MDLSTNFTDMQALSYTADEILVHLSGPMFATLLHAVHIDYLEI